MGPFLLDQLQLDFSLETEVQKLKEKWNEKKEGIE